MNSSLPKSICVNPLAFVFFAKKKRDVGEEKRENKKEREERERQRERESARERKGEEGREGETERKSKRDKGLGCKYEVKVTLTMMILKKLNNDDNSSSSAFPSYISGVHHFWVRFLRM